MKALIVYDSFYGNTERIAQAISKKLSDHGTTELVRINDYKDDLLNGVDLLVIGSPTRAFNPTPNIKAFINKLSKEKLKTLKIAVFDTRISVEETNIKFLIQMVKWFGYATDKIAKILKRKKATLIVPPEWFIVMDSEGPLMETELDHATTWAENIVNAL